MVSRSVLTGNQTLFFSQLETFIDWPHFFYAWSVPPESVQARELKEDAIRMLRELDSCFCVRYVCEPFLAYSQGDDVIIPDMGISLPFLRQQRPSQDGYCLCLSDFVKPYDGVGMVMDTIYIYATTVDESMVEKYIDDDYRHLLAQTLADRLAEAASEYLSSFGRIRPAVGYPSIPDMSMNFLLGKLIDFASLGITLTSSGMMKPHASVSGLILPNPQARYFAVGKISEEQIVDYARRRGMPVNTLRNFIDVQYSDDEKTL